jgi:DNA-binding XRE family transcriptional regulator
MRVVHVRVSLADFGGVFEAMREWLDRKNCVLEQFGTQTDDGGRSSSRRYLPRTTWPSRSGANFGGVTAIERPPIEAGSMNAQAFKAWRKRFGHTQEQAAELLGVSRRVVAGWETNEIRIPKMVGLAIWAIERGGCLEQRMAELDEIIG